MNILLPLAGPTKAFDTADYPHGKHLIELAGRPLIQHIVENLRTIPHEKFIFIIRREDAARYHLDQVLRLLEPEAQQIIVPAETAGAACSALLAAQFIDNDQPLLIANADQAIEADLAGIISEFRFGGYDGGTVVFDSVHPRWSYVMTDEQGLVVEAAEKRPLGRNATAGLYYFSQGHTFVRSAFGMIRKDASVGGTFYVCPVFNEMVLAGARIGVRRIRREAYFSLATPQGVEQYEQHLGRPGRRRRHANRAA